MLERLIKSVKPFSKIKNLEPLYEKAILKSEIPQNRFTEFSEKDLYYYLFENCFYDKDIITKIQSGYIQFIPQNSQKCFLDIGCGRGEFLEILQKNGIKVKGIEINTLEYKLLKDKNFDVELNDAVTYLKNTDEILHKGYTKESKDGTTTYYKGTGDSKTQVEQSEAVSAPTNSGYYGIRFAFDVPNKPNSWSTLSGWIQGDNGSSYSMPLPIFKGAESYFLLAEAELRGWITAQEAGGSVQELYERGVRASIQNEVDYRGPYANLTTPINASAAADEYLNQTSGQADLDDPIDDSLDHEAMNHLGAKWVGGDQEQQLEQIIIQKYLALFPLSTEAWAEQRRTGYPRLFPALINQGGASYVNTEEGLRRVIYSSNEYDTNAAELNNSGLKLLNEENTSKTGITGDNGGTRVWWDNANKGNF